MYGHSDDCCEIEGIVTDEIGCYDRRVVVKVGDPAIGGCFVTLHNNGLWEVNVGLMDEDVPVPWPISVYAEHGYSMCCEIACPEGTPVSWTVED